MNSQSQPNWNLWKQPWPQPQNDFQAWMQSMQNPYGRFAQFYQYPPSFQNQQAPQLPNQGQQLSLPYPQKQQPPPQNQILNYHFNPSRNQINFPLNHYQIQIIGTLKMLT